MSAAALLGLFSSASSWGGHSFWMDDGWLDAGQRREREEKKDGNNNYRKRCQSLNPYGWGAQTEKENTLYSCPTLKGCTSLTWPKAGHSKAARFPGRKSWDEMHQFYDNVNSTWRCYILIGLFSSWASKTHPKYKASLTRLNGPPSKWWDFGMSASAPPAAAPPAPFQQRLLPQLLSAFQNANRTLARQQHFDPLKVTFFALTALQE